MSRLNKLVQIVKNYGAGFLLYRTWYLLEHKTGWLKRKFPIRLWDTIHLEDYVNGDLSAMLSRERVFFFPVGRLPKGLSGYQEKIVQQADEILQHRFFYFFNQRYFMGEKPDWFSNPVTGKRANVLKHWSEMQDFDVELGDIKYIWEPSRFAWAYLLVRAFAVTGDEKYPAKFWELFEAWLEKNQPNRGPNYYCGQECSLRLMALCFAGMAFFNAASTTQERKARLVKAVAVHAERIDGNIRYAISTRTNHALTEATGIYTAGLLFPEFKKAARWRRRGKEILVREGMKQIFDDGSYIQHSMNYHRVMVQTILWALQLDKLYHQEFPEEFIRKFNNAVDFLYQMQDGETGRVPNYGSNDGSIIFPLNSCDYLDYRPVIQSAHYLITGQKLYATGAWDEDLLWFFGEKALAAPLVAKPYHGCNFNDGGYYTLRGKQSWGMIRCHSFKTRPGHGDCLHLDLWWNGINLLRDSGSYLYHSKKPWKLYFIGSAARNTITVDDQGQMSHGERFITFDWLQASRPVTSRVDGNSCFSGAHFGFKRLGDNIVHHRSVLLIDELNCWIVVDDVTGKGCHKTSLHWQLADCVQEIRENSVLLNCDGSPVMLSVQAGNGSRFEYYKGNEQVPAGFQSLYYGEKTPAPVIMVTVERELPVRFISVISPGGNVQTEIQGDALILSNSNNDKYSVRVDRNPSLNKTVFN